MALANDPSDRNRLPLIAADDSNRELVAHDGVHRGVFASQAGVCNGQLHGSGGSRNSS